MVLGPRVMRVLKAATTESLAELRAAGRKVVIIEPIPHPPFDPIQCLSHAEVLEECRYPVTATPDWLELFYRQLARNDKGVVSAHFDRLICPFLPICDPIVNNQIVSWDQTHLTASFAKTLAPVIDDYLKQTGILPR